MIIIFPMLVVYAFQESTAPVVAVVSTGSAAPEVCTIDVHSFIAFGYA